MVSESLGSVKVFMKDFAPIFRDEIAEAVAYNEHKNEFSEIVFRINEIRLKKLNKAQKIINEYVFLNKKIFGGC